MLKIEQITSQLDEALDVTSSESDFSYEYYLDLTTHERAIHIRNEQNKRSRSFDDTIIQTVCVTMERASRIICAGVELSDCVILRSTVKLPDTIELHNRDGILSVGSPDITRKRISHVDYKTIPDRGHTEISKKEVYSFLMDGYLYLYSMDNTYLSVKTLMVRAVFEDPLALEDFINPDGSKCFDRLEDDYPVSMAMWAQMIKPNVLKLLLRDFMMPKDMDPDNKEENEQRKVQREV
jgi:hypothetical protein